MNRIVALLLSVFVAFSFVACESKKDSGEEKEEKAEEGGEEEAGGEEAGGEEAGGEEAGGEEGSEGGSSMVDIEKFGIKMELPEGAEVGDGIGGDGVMIQAPGFALSVDEAGDMTPADMATAKEDTSMYNGAAEFNEEELEDGWAFTFVNEGGMGKNYHVQVRRTIGDKDLYCSTMMSSPEQQATALAACKSMTQ